METWMYFSSTSTAVVTGVSASAYLHGSTGRCGSSSAGGECLQYGRSYRLGCHTDIGRGVARRKAPRWDHAQYDNSLRNDWYLVREQLPWLHYDHCVWGWNQCRRGSGDAAAYAS